MHVRLFIVVPRNTSLAVSETNYLLAIDTPFLALIFIGIILFRCKACQRGKGKKDLSTRFSAFACVENKYVSGLDRREPPSPRVVILETGMNRSVFFLVLPELIQIQGIYVAGLKPTCSRIRV